MNLRLKIALWLESLRRRNLKSLHPLQQLFWESTLRCNVHCLHCGSDCLSSVETPDMPAEDFLKVIDTEVTPHVDPHRVLIVISGGEPLMRTDLAEVGMALKKRGYPWGMVTNGLALTEKRFRELRAAGLRSITVSLDGLEEDHVWLRQHPMAFEGACRAIRLLASEPGLTWDVVTCVNPRNYNQLEEIKEYLLSLGCRRWRLFSIFPMGRAAHDPELQLTDEQFTGVLDFVKRTREEGRMYCSYACEGYLGSYERQVRDNYYYCRAGIEVASVLCDGSISGCTSIRSNLHQGNIYKDDLWDVWQNAFEPYRDRRWARKGECAKCKVWRYCEGNGLHLYDDNRELLSCSLHRIKK